VITPEDEKLAVEGVKAAASTAMSWLPDLITKLAGPAAEELGLTLQDSVKVFRFRRRLRLFQRINEICAEAGIDPQAVPLTTLLPAVEYASIEQEDSLQDRWAALLANAANPVLDLEVLPSYPEKLKQLSQLDAKILDWMYDKIESAKQANDIDFPGISFREIHQTFSEGLPVNDYDIQKLKPLDVLNEVMRHKNYLTVHLDNLIGLRLIMLRPKDLMSLGDAMPVELVVADDYYELTPLGEGFVKACRAPKKRRID
jgi:hypothetical protein